MIVNVIGLPVQLTPALVKVGVTVIVDTSVVVPELVAVNAGIKFPFPDIGNNPIFGFELVHV